MNIKLTQTDLDVIKYLMTGCEDLNLFTKDMDPAGCERCPIERKCKDVRYKLWGKDVLKETKYRMQVDEDL